MGPASKALPQAVPNSFIRMMKQQEADLIITHPEGYALDPKLTQGIPCITDQEEAFQEADFIYGKNWSSYESYGQVLRTDSDWMITEKKMSCTREAKFMHCLPVRRNVVVTDGVLDSPNNLVIEQANNRTYTAQAVLQKYCRMADLHLIKVGGNLLENSLIRKKFLTHFALLEGPKILVHGGGKSATILAEKMGLEVQMVEGRRITDRAMLEIACMTYAGLLNKSIVSELQALDCNAIGLSGADGNAIRAVKRPVKEIDYGFVGDITKINTALFDQFCQSRIVPVCCALTHDGQGQLLNTNADTLAAAISICLSTKYKSVSHLLL